MVPPPALPPAAVVTMPSGPAAADPRVAGRFVLDRGASGDVRRAVDTVVSRMNFFLRPVARGRLRSACEAYEHLNVMVSPLQVVTIAEGHPPVVSPADGTPATWRRENGEVYRVTTRFNGEQLVQTFTSGEGTRENVYTPDPDGRTMTVVVTVNGPRLPIPVTYRLVYRRQEPSSS